VHAAGSGVGTASVQLATALGARTVGTARSAHKLERCTALGLEAGIVPPLRDDGTLDTDALAAQVIDATDNGANVVLDLVGGPYVEADIGATAPKGRIVLIGTLAGGSATMRVHIVMGKRLQIFGTVLRSRTDEEKADATSAFARDVVPLLEREVIAPVVDSVMPLEDVERAYDVVAADASFGKVILDCR
jgi:NADPH2:quinone reductase